MLQIILYIINILFLCVNPAGEGFKCLQHYPPYIVYILGIILQRQTGFVLL